MTNTAAAGPQNTQVDRVPVSRSAKVTAAFRTTAVQFLILLFACGSLSACGGGGGGSSPAPTAPTPDPPANPANFVNRTSFVELAPAPQRRFSILNTNLLDMAQRFAGGIAAADYDADGDIDLYVTGGDGVMDQLLRNDGNNNYTEVASSVGLNLSHLGSGPLFADVDGDADLDLVIGGIEFEQVRLFLNDNGSFVPAPGNGGLNLTTRNTISAAFADIDGDADLDLFLSHWGTPAPGDTQSLWRNDGIGNFTNVSVGSGISGSLITAGTAGLIDYTFTPTFSDINGDHRLDLLIVGDFLTSEVFLGDGEGGFSRVTDRDVIKDRNGMGSAVGDYDNDGDMDWFVSSIFETSDTDANIGNRLYRNRGDGTFEDVTDSAGVANGGWGWGSCMEDFDNDGDLDIVHVNGWDTNPGGNNDYTRDRIRYFENQGDGQFSEESIAVGLLHVGQGRGISCFDSDRDGDLDLAITNNSPDAESLLFYVNGLDADNHYLDVVLRDQSGNRHGIGAWVEVTAPGMRQVREVRAGNNFTSQNPAEVHFGLHDVTEVEVMVRWPDGEITTMAGVAADQRVAVTR